ncbi:MAG TPA: hypothetical protein PK640_04370, partial [Verrucomicrobiota bacterium]|nr:hypothetical protein [Verrucomicrobiota bacterium]
MNALFSLAGLSTTTPACLLPGRLVARHRPLTPSLSHPTCLPKPGRRQVGEGVALCGAGEGGNGAHPGDSSVRPGARTRFAVKAQRALELLLVTGILSAAHGASSDTQFLRLPVKEYRDKMKGGWIGQIVGVSWGGPTEFKWQDKTIPADQMPAWRPSMINDAFGQDDLYVEMTFL